MCCADRDREVLEVTHAEAKAILLSSPRRDDATTYEAAKTVLQQQLPDALVITARVFIADLRAKRWHEENNVARPRPACA
jgi:hypothetical protein